MFKDKILLITGGTGSFGNAVLNRFLETDIKYYCRWAKKEKSPFRAKKENKEEKI